MAEVLMRPEVLVLGAGNTVMADEGIGPTCVARLDEGFDFPHGVKLEDVGTMGFGILSLLSGIKHLVVIDAAKDSGHPAGTVVLYTPEDLAEAQVMHSAHDPRLVDVLRAAAMTGVDLTSVVIVGVQIESMEQFVLELTPAVAAAVPVACAAALDCLRKLGYEATAKEGADVADILEVLATYSA